MPWAFHEVKRKECPGTLSSLMRLPPSSLPILLAVALAAVSGILPAKPDREGTATAAKGVSSAESAVTRTVEAVYPAIVRIEVVTEKGSSGRMMKSRATGSGVIISGEGHVVTNHHVAGKATRINCRLGDGEELAAGLQPVQDRFDVVVASHWLYGAEESVLKDKIENLINQPNLSNNLSKYLFNFINVKIFLEDIAMKGPWKFSHC